jgi:lysophospholipase L1-like esterase
MTNRFDRSCVLTIGLAALIGSCGGGSSGDGSGSGGSSGTGGATSTGGSTATGGASATGGSTASGGATGTGGVTGTGGSPSTGGSTGTGGAPATGGVSGTGGASATGGAGGAGGAKGAAGSKGTGGATSTGGTGGKAGRSGTAGSTGTGGTAGTSGTTHTGPWKVMLLGDSVTESTCYPQITDQMLIAGNHTNFQFVGMETTTQSCGSGAPASAKDEGHAGYGVTYLPQNNTRSACTKDSGCGSYAELLTWAAEKPDIVLMHYGTNDVWDGIATSTILSAYVAVIAEFRKQNPNVIFFVSKIIKLSPSGCTSCLTNVAALAAALTPAWASSNSTASSPITLIDHYDSSFDPTNSADTADGVHPTPAGASIMATVTVNAIAASGYF